MAAPDFVEAGEIWLGTTSTDAEKGYYQADDLTYAQLAQFIRKLTIGDATKDSDDYISTYVMGDFSGGGQKETLNEGADANRFYVAFAETDAPNRNALPPLVTAVRPNSNCSSCYPLGVGNDGIFYAAFNESGTWKVWGYQESTAAFDYNGGTGVALGSAPSGKAVRFDGVIYVPRGSSGYTRITGVAGTPTCTTVAGSADPTTASPTSAPRPLAFRVFQQRLWAVTAEGGIAYHTIVQKDAGANAWTWPYGTTTTDFPHIEASATAQNLAVFPDKNGVESLYVKTDRGLLVFDDVNGVFLETHVEFPPHPDINQALAIWPPGGDLHAPVGLNDVKYSTAFVADAHFGLARDHGLPNDYRGVIADLEPTVDRLYALVGGVSETSTSLAYDSKFGADGSGDGQFTVPAQVALDSSGNIYVADIGNDRVIKFTSGGVFSSNIVTSVDAVSGVCLDSSDNIYVTYKNAANDYRVRKYNSSGTLQWTTSAIALSSTVFIHCATDGTHVYTVDQANNLLYKFLCSDGSYVASYGGSGNGDGQFNTPYGLAYSSVTGTLYVSEQANDRVQELTTAGVFVRKWGSNGSSNGQFTTATGIGIHPSSGNVYVADSGRDDLQVFTSTGTYVRKVGSSGTGNGQFATPDGVAVNSSGSVWVSDVQAGDDDRVQKFVEQTTSSAVIAYPSLHYWTGVGWHGAWKGTSTSATPTHLVAGDATSAYRLWFGMTDGYAYHCKLRRDFHNAAVGFLAGVDEFSAGGDGVAFIETGWFDAAMQGFDKIASHLIVLDALATATETIAVEYKVDGGGWQDLGTVTSNGTAVLAFNEVDGFSRGQRFNKIAFRYTFARGGTVTNTPVLDAATLHFTKIPQNTTSFTLTVPLTEHRGRDAATQYNDLTNLVTAGEFLQLVHRRDSYDSDATSVSATFRVLIAAIAGGQDTGESMTGRADLTLIAIPVPEAA